MTAQLSEDEGFKKEEAYLGFLLEEGLQLLADFKRIGDPEKRVLIMKLAAMLAEDSPSYGAY